MGNIALPSHPESFQLDAATDNLWVNLPGSGLIGICNLKQVKMTATWSKLLPRANFPMAYDKDQHRIIVGYRVPARTSLLVPELKLFLVASRAGGDQNATLRIYNIMQQIK